MLFLCPNVEGYPKGVGCCQDKLGADHDLALVLNNEQEKLKADLVNKTAELEAKLAELASEVSETQKIVKMDFDQSRWKEFGIDAKR